jgi:hypothetical protein
MRERELTNQLRDSKKLTGEIEVAFSRLENELESQKATNEHLHQQVG